MLPVDEELTFEQMCEEAEDNISDGLPFAPWNGKETQEDPVQESPSFADSIILVTPPPLPSDYSSKEELDENPMALDFDQGTMTHHNIETPGFE